MVKMMTKTALIAGFLFALPLAAQNPAPNPPAQENSPAQNPQAAPKLEPPQMAAPEPETEKKPAAPPVKAAKPA